MKCYVEVYGCTANKSDANLVKGLIISHPHHFLVSTVEEADLLIILTCTVISTTEQRMLHRLTELTKLNKQVVIAGCMASIQQKKLKNTFPEAFLIPPRKIHHLLDLINHKETQESLEQKAKAPKQYSHLIAPIAIAEGCLFSCSYCITHLARGKLYSYPEDDVICAVKDAVQQGCKEIQLTAQDTASYGLDRGSSLPALIKKIVKIKGEFMIRIGMMNPRTAKNIFPELLNIYQYNNVFSFLHLPLQSGDNHILNLMNRGYSIEEGVSIIQRARRSIPELTISTDVIVGFPSETNDQYHKTINLLKQIQPDIVNITRFSARPFTKAKNMNGRLPTEIVKQRSQEISKISKYLTGQRNKKYIGKTLSVLTVQKGKQDTILARSNNYKPVIIKTPVPLGVKRTVEICDATEAYLVGMLK